MAVTKPDEAYPGRIVYLYPNTKTAGEWCWRKKTAVVVDTQYWPRICVELEHKGKTVTTYPHREDVMLRPTGQGSAKTEKRDGDMAGGGTPDTKVRVMPGRIKPVELAENEEQGTLF